MTDANTTPTDANVVPSTSAAATNAAMDVTPNTGTSPFGMKREATRKLIHLLTIIAIPADYFFYESTTVLVGSILCIAYLATEYFRFKGENVAFITDMIKYCSREKELKGWVLTPFYILFSITVLIGLTAMPAKSLSILIRNSAVLADGMILAKSAAYVGIIAATLGDSSAAIIGRRFGKHRHWILKGKSVEGSLAFLFVTFAGSVLFVNWQVALIVASAAAVIEIFSAGYDNLTVPFGVAILASLI